MKKITLLGLALGLTIQSGLAGNLSSRADGHAPIGVMGDHVHREGKAMLSYRYGYMEMDGNLNGTSRVSTQDVLQDFMVVPVEMTTERHMLGAMFAANDTLTLMAMVPYVSKSMDHITRRGSTFTTEADGLGDLTLGGLVSLVSSPETHVHLNLGISLPTGDIDAKDQTPMGNAVLPYPMQLGSGTYDLLTGITATGHRDRVSFGGQANATIRMDENDRDYTLGHAGSVTTWASYSLNQQTSASLRLVYRGWGDIDGADAALNPRMVQTADPDRQGGERLELGFGINLLGTGAVKGHRLALEVLLPIYQDLNGPQLESEIMTVVGWQKAF